MIINVNKISDRGYALTDTIEIDSTHLLEDESFFLEGIEYQIFLKRQNQRVQAQGKIKTAISLICVSCLEQFDLKINSRFDIILFPSEMVDQRNTALDEEELEYIFYENDQIDLEKILIEQVNLFTPFKPVCKAECKGICSSCGTNLNHSPCQCEQNKNEIKFLFEKVKR
ncbi:MAG: DUF177 domain-containing protein [Chrysiogenales bacterium]|nr:MAG: DUF177 domain-containing protein [Chrysiogenales bacterium]